ncbi:MAG: hypothetical protein ACE5L6_01230 [Candidatus Bathyarchaeia archaeon]
MCRECGCAAPPYTYRHRHPHRRRFLTKEEKIEKLENYAEELKKELTAVEERIKELKT